MGFSALSNYPVDDATGVNVRTYISVTFDGVIDLTSITEASLTVNAAGIGNLPYYILGVSDNTLYIQPYYLPNNTLITVTLYAEEYVVVTAGEWYQFHGTHMCSRRIGHKIIGATVGNLTEAWNEEVTN